MPEVKEVKCELKNSISNQNMEDLETNYNSFEYSYYIDELPFPSFCEKFQDKIIENALAGEKKMMKIFDNLNPSLQPNEK